MTTNPAGMIRMLVTYGLCILFAVLMGVILTNVGVQPTYGNLFILGLLAAVVISPIFIKWHYPIMVFGLGCPVTIFFLKGSPPLWEIVVILSLGIAIVERSIQRNHKWLSAPSIVWPLVFTFIVMLITAKLTGGFGFHTLGNSMGGGRKYLTLTLGIATFFALIARKIPVAHRNLYLGLFLLSGVPAFLGDLGPLLPSPLNLISVLIPSTVNPGDEWKFGVTRLGDFGRAANVIAGFMLARFGMRGIFTGPKLWGRVPVFLLMFAFTMLGGFRNMIFNFVLTCGLMFFLEGLHRTKLLPLFAIFGLSLACLIVPFANHLPYTFQRALSFLPLEIDPLARADAEASSEWRFRIWDDLWPKVPQYLLLGKGYALTEQDFDMLSGALANGAETKVDASLEAAAGDYHNGPLSTLIPFGIWGGLTFLWFMLAGLRVVYRNYKYGEAQVRIINIFLLVQCFLHILNYFLIYGAYADDLFEFAQTIGFSIALNGGVLGPQPQLKAAVPSPATRITGPEWQPV
jgi:hypothetical protein